MLTLKAPAKINLTLEVLGRRDDGYHDVASIMQTVDLFDTVSLEPSADLSVEWDADQVAPQENLALRAARLLKEATGAGGGARITVQKSIPISAGLGGGSSDAAAALAGLNRLWGTGLSTEELTPIAARIGSDVPFFLHGGAAMVAGRGEQVRPLPTPELNDIVLLSPAIDLPEKTAAVYGKLTSASYTRGLLTRKLEARIRGGGDVPAQFLFNAFDQVAFDAFPGLDEYWNAFESMGAREIHLAGSGPSMFAIVSRKEMATTLSLLLRHSRGWNSQVVSAWRPPNEAGD